MSGYSFVSGVCTEHRKCHSTKRAAALGHLDCIKNLRSQGINWTYKSVTAAIESGKFECLKWLVENGCKYDDRAALAVARSYYKYTSTYKKGNEYKEMLAQNAILIKCWNYISGRVYLGSSKIFKESIYNDFTVGIIKGLELGNKTCLDTLASFCRTGHVEYLQKYMGSVISINCLYRHQTELENLAVEAAQYGRLNCLKYLVKYGLEITFDIYKISVIGNKLDCTEYSYRNLERSGDLEYYGSKYLVSSIKANNLSSIIHMRQLGHEYKFQSIFLTETYSPLNLTTYIYLYEDLKKFRLQVNTYRRFEQYYSKYNISKDQLTEDYAHYRDFLERIESVKSHDLSIIKYLVDMGHSPSKSIDSLVWYINATYEYDINSIMNTLEFVIGMGQKMTAYHIREILNSGHLCFVRYIVSLNLKYDYSTHNTSQKYYYWQIRPKMAQEYLKLYKLFKYDKTATHKNRKKLVTTEHILCDKFDIYGGCMVEVLDKIIMTSIRF
jgi:hypothetical protein